MMHHDARQRGAARAALLLPLAALLAPGLPWGCAHREAPGEELVRARSADFGNLTRPRGFAVLDSSYLGARAIHLSEENAPVLSTHVTMKSVGTFRDTVAALARLVPVTVNLVEDRGGAADSAEEPAGKGRRAGKAAGSGQALGPGETAQPRTELDALLEGDLSALPELADYALPARTLSIDYSGPLRGLLDQIGAQSGYGWDFDRESNTVTIASRIVRTFTLNATPGSVALDTRITNRSREENSSGSLSSSSRVNDTARSSTASSQTTQTATLAMTYDTWREVLENVKILLSPRGRVTGSMATGTITVHDHPDNVRKVRRYVAGINAVLDRQVALRINVYSLVLEDEGNAGIDLSLLFSSPDVSLVAGALTLGSGTAGTTSATIVKGALKGSQGVIQALSQWGTATEVTSGGLVVRNNVPAPLQAIRKTGYVAGTSSETTDYGQSMEVTPGEISTGFSMTVLPHIVDGRTVILHCNVSLSYLESLDEFTSGTTVVQLPQTSSRAFSQSASMQMGQTLVLAGYQQASQGLSHSAGLLTATRSADFDRSILIITIEVENAAPELLARGA